MKYAVELASGGMIYIPSFMKFGIGFQKVGRGRYTYRHTYRAEWSDTPVLIASK
jgi:hypothetical protein